MRELLWVVVVAVVIILVVAFIIRAIGNRRGGARFETRALPGSYYSAYQARMTELQSMFVSHPRESVAGAQLARRQHVHDGSDSLLGRRSGFRDPVGCIAVIPLGEATAGRL